MSEADQGSELAAYQAALLAALYDTESPEAALSQARAALVGSSYEDALQSVELELLELAQTIVKAWARD